MDCYESNKGPQKYKGPRDAKEEAKPETVLDVIEQDYPEKYGLLRGGLCKLERMFTPEDWLNILTRSRASHEHFLKRPK